MKQRPGSDPAFLPSLTPQGLANVACTGCPFRHRTSPGGGFRGCRQAEMCGAANHTAVPCVLTERWFCVGGDQTPPPPAHLTPCLGRQSKARSFGFGGGGWPHGQKCPAARLKHFGSKCGKTPENAVSGPFSAFNQAGIARTTPLLKDRAQTPPGELARIRICRIVFFLLKNTSFLSHFWPSGQRGQAPPPNQESKPQ